MKILVATRATQGAKDNDFYWTNDGELVFLGFTCDRDLRNPEMGCGCGRSFSGVETGRATTTATVIESEMTREQFESTVEAKFVLDGWDAEFAGDAVDQILWVADRLPVGAIVERRLDEFSVRELVS
ncbi:DUF7715 family protein [Agromyces humi]|uniref:DUF7715 family protein n=1 Tax=Agromyces humi TaxID=1766800 RepID=UPI001359FFCF|nr:hypothetical protein [Agromyces humi]